MGKKILDSKILYVLVSILLSVVLWFYVSAVRGNSRTNPIRNIPVTFVGTDVLQENGLMLLGPPPTVNLEITANITILPKLTAQSLTLTVDVSHITEPTEYTLSYDILPPAGVSESLFNVTSRDPANVTFTVVRYDTKEVPIRGVVAEGSSIAEGFVSRGFQFSPETVTVAGRADLVAQVQYALVTISGEDMAETIQEARTYQLVGADNEPLVDLDVTCSPEVVETTYEILREIEVPLRVNIEAGGGATYEDNVSFLNIEPRTVMVLGKPEDLESLKELTVGTINLADIDGTQILTRDIPLADELEISGGVSTATITITVDGLEKRVFEIDRGSFTIINEPEEFRAQVSTRSLAVTIRGTPEALEEISADNIRVTVDLANINLASGQYVVDARVQFDNTEGVGVLNSNYQVTVRLTPR